MVRIYDFTVFGLRYVSRATSALLMPWVISARISASRSLRPSPRPGQSSPGALRVRAATSLTTTSPECTASKAATSSRAGRVFDR